jgi:hypothetical protein
MKLYRIVNKKKETSIFLLEKTSFKLYDCFINSRLNHNHDIIFIYFFSLMYLNR